MCVITTAATAAALTSIGATSMAASTVAVGLTTVAANAVVGAALGAGVSAATGARGKALWRSALIGGAGAGILSGVGMALGGITTVSSTTSAVENGLTSQTVSNTGGLLAKPMEGAPVFMKGGEQVVLVGSGETSHWVPISEVATKTGGTQANLGLNGMSAADAAKASMLSSGNASLGIAGMTGITSAVGALAESDATIDSTRAQIEAQRKHASVQAANANRQAEIDKMDLARRQHATIGTGKAVSAANGVMLENRKESSPNVWEEDAREELAFQQSRIDENNRMQIAAIREGYNSSASLLAAEARTARRTGNLRATTSLIKAGATGFTSLYGRPGVTMYS